MKITHLSRLASILLLVITPALLAQTAPPAPAPTTATAPATTTASSGPERFAKNIDAFAQQDLKSPPPANPTLFLGSSTFTLWTNLTKEFTDYKPINRGFGGSTMPDILYFFDRVVTPYKPKTIVLYVGSNDMTGNKTPPEKFLENFKTFHQKLQAACPDTEVYFLSIIPAPKREPFIPGMDKANQLVKDYIAQHPKLHYIDARYALSTPDKKPNPDLYKSDRVHPNEKGYAIIAPLIKAALNPAQSTPKP